MKKQLAIEFLHFVLNTLYVQIAITKPYTYSFINDGCDPSSQFIVPANKERLTSVELFDMFMDNREKSD